jgi:RND family efflux transporter MFP subunit
MTSTDSNSQKSFRWFVVAGLITLLLAAFAVVVLFEGQRNRVLADAKTRAVQAAEGPVVQVAVAKRIAGNEVLTLLGEADPYQAITLYAKVSGYMKNINVDKGDRVRAGEVLAVIESPEIDKQYQAAVADAENKRLIAERAATLVKKQMISQQDADQAEADSKVSVANREQLATLKSYEVLRAPFNGTVTARFADPGALIQNATSSQSSSLPVVSIAETGRLRIYVYVDQAHAAFVHVGDPATVLDPAQPGLKIAARVTRTSGEIDLKTRTLLVEIDLANPRNRVLPGSFVQVELTVRTPRYVEVPSDALMARGSQTLVARVTAGNRIQFQPVVVADQTGESVRLLSGLQEGEKVARNLGDRVAEGAVVQPAVAP